MDRMKIGNRIKELRKMKYMSQKELASKINLPTTTLSGYETNRREPPIDILLQLCDIFKVNLNYLVLGPLTIANKKLNTLIFKLIQNTTNNNISWRNLLEESSLLTKGPDYKDTILDFASNLIGNLSSVYLCKLEDKNIILITTFRLYENSENKEYVNYLCYDNFKNGLQIIACDSVITIDEKTLSTVPEIKELLEAIQNAEKINQSLLDELINALDFD